MAVKGGMTMTGDTIGVANTHVVTRSVRVEPAGVGSAVVFQRIHCEGGEEVEIKTTFASLNDALAFASGLYRDEACEQTPVLEF